MKMITDNIFGNISSHKFQAPNVKVLII